MLARDAAALALCYGAGLRISEALASNGGDAPTGEADAITIVGKGQKSRSTPIIPPVRKAVEDYLLLCPFALKPRLFRRRDGGPLSPRIVQLAMAVRPAESATPHALRPSSFATHLLARGGDLSTDRKICSGCLAVHDAGLYRSSSSARLLAAYRSAHPRA